MSKNYSHIALEGGIGSGKSTLLEGLGPYLNKNIKVYTEDVDNWLSLGLFYEDQRNFAFLLQAEILTSYKSIKQRGMFLTERSPKASIEVFSRMQVARNNLTESNLKALKHYEESFLPQPQAILYVDVSPKAALERIKKRGRISEATISLDYLIELEKFYFEWFERTTIPLFFINGENSLNQTRSNCLKALEEINPLFLSPSQKTMT